MTLEEEVAQLRNKVRDLQAAYDLLDRSSKHQAVYTPESVEIGDAYRRGVADTLGIKFHGEDSK